jgi:glycosyltransferase involved in cell wall biosynthesis
VAPDPETIATETAQSSSAAGVLPAPTTPALARLSVLLPIYNERATLLELLERVLAVPVEKEVLLVDDASTDGTTDLLKSAVEGRFPNVRVFYHATNRGKGAALRTAIPEARGAVCIIQDGDLEYDPNDYLPILAAFTDPSVSVVYGSRFLRGWPSMRLANRLINHLLPLLVQLLYGAKLSDEATCYKAFRTELLQRVPLACERFEFCPEVTAKVLRLGYRIVEVPIHYEARSLAEGKKIRWTDGVEAIWTLVKFRFRRF